MTPTGRAKLAGIAGDPIGHSLSPRIHTHWLNAYGIDGAYVPLPVRKDAFSVAVRGLRAAGFVGINVTLPHKEAAYALADELDSAARAAGAVNLLLFKDGGLQGRNTDVEGLSQSILEGLGANQLEGRPVVVMGSGGAARAAILALSGLGAAEIRLLARNVSRGEMLIRALKPYSSALLHAFRWQDWPRAAPEVRLLVNATSAGMSGLAPPGLSFDPLPREAAVCDIVYNPLETEFLKAARARGHVTLDGLGMLMHQAVPAFADFYGVRPQVTPQLRAELEEALRGGH